MSSTPTETLEKWIAEAKIPRQLIKHEVRERDDKILILCKALQSSVEVINEKDEALKRILHPTKLGEHEDPWFYRQTMAKKALALEPHLEGLERLE